MELNTLYVYESGNQNLLSLVLPLLLILSISMLLIKFKGFYLVNYPLLKKILVFISYLSFTISTIFIILVLLSYFNNSDQLVDRYKGIGYEEKSVVEGSVTNYKLNKINGQCFESFEINNVLFEYSDNVIDLGYNMTAFNGGVIYENGLEFIITYTIIENENKIIKIQTY